MNHQLFVHTMTSKPERVKGERRKPDISSENVSVVIWAGARHKVLFAVVRNEVSEESVRF